MSDDLKAQLELSADASGRHWWRAFLAYIVNARPVAPHAEEPPAHRTENVDACAADAAFARAATGPTPCAASSIAADAATQVEVVMEGNQIQRELGQAVAEVRFGIEYGALNERFWQNIDTVLNWVQVMAGALAVGGYVTGGPMLATAGAVLAAVSGTQIALQPARRAYTFREARAAWHDLNKRAWQMSLHELDAALEELRKTAPVGLQSLKQPAANAVALREGAPVYPLRWHERLLRALA
jgi:hypothetical protein